MYSSRTSLPQTPLSASKSQRIFSSSRRPGSFLTSTSRRSFTPKNQSYSRSFQTSVIEETAQHTVEVYGTPLPVLVTEAITVAERIADVSVKIEESGWASLVCGRRLFIWRYKQDIGSRNSVAHCRELTLPASDLAHKADLVHVIGNRDMQMPSALAVSPEGIVRYWPNIAHEGSSLETAADLQGQECFSLTSFHPFGCILATTTSSLVLISPSAAEGQHNISCRTLKIPHGVLAGIGRRVSSFIFGAMPTQTSESKQLNKVLSVTESDHSEQFFYVLSGSTLQKWQLVENESDKLLWEIDMDRYVKEGFLDALWNGDTSHLHQLKTWCLDIQAYQGNVIVLAAGMNPNIAHHMYYALGAVESSDSHPLVGFTSFHVVNHFEVYTEPNEEKLLSFKFIIPSLTDKAAFIYGSLKVICVSVTSGHDPDIIEFNANGNMILGAGACDSVPLLFTHLHGLVSIHPTQNSFLDTSIHQVSHRSFSIKGPENAETNDTLPSQLKSAMVLYVKGEVEKYKKIIDDMIANSISASGDDSVLDNAVVSLSISLIDDYPVSDPRWCESVPAGDSVSSSLIILHQLEDKLKAHDFLINFLKASGLWELLSMSKIRETAMSTCLLLCEHAEKLVAAKIIRKYLVDHNEILNEVIKDALAKRGIEVKNHLTHQDMFFREVSCVDSLFMSLVEWEESQLYDDFSAKDNLRVVGTVNEILVGIFQAVLNFRQTKALQFDYQQNLERVEYVPWTAVEGSFGTRTMLMKQHSINVEYALKIAEDVQSKGSISQLFMDLIDILLDGYKNQLTSLKGKDHYPAFEARYIKERNKFIRPLLDVGQYERAAILAEKYLDFDILVELCEDTNDKERLQIYILQFKEEGFCDFVFKWYFDKGKRGKLLVQPFGQSAELGKFLQGHENISWLHHIQNNQYSLAQQTLKELAYKEHQYLSRKKTLLSLSKLSALASDSPVDIKNSQIEALNFEQDLILHQEALPLAVCQAFGFDPETARVLSPEELIEMYISEENTEANQYDFKIALDLLSFIKKPPGDAEVEGIRRHIWCKAILRDNWEELDVNNPLEAIRSTIFFQIIDLAYVQGVELHDFLPPVDGIIHSPELNSLVDNPSFIFLLQAAYEYLDKTMV